MAVLGAVAITAAVSSATTSALALPGGANSLRETHGEWTVSCVRQKAATRCAMSQMQADPKTRKRVLTMELQLKEGGNATGVLLMPFGLALKPGVELRVDNQQTGMPFAYSTCLPAGCVVPLSADPALLSALKAGSKLNIKAVANADNQPLAFVLPLNGFSASLERLTELAD